MKIRIPTDTADEHGSNIPTLESRFSKSASIITHGGLGHDPGSPSHTPTTDNSTSTPEDITKAIDLYASQFVTGQPRSLSGAALRSFLLGFVFSVNLVFCLFLSCLHLSIWRAPFFISNLCLFHFLEYWATAYANPSGATISSFLLTSNGVAYNVAHSCALLEIILTHLFISQSLIPRVLQRLRFCLGIFLLVMGQLTRTLAILTAGPSFSHIVAYHKHSTHKLVTHGIYSILRHPSYFGFFWWGIGTQLVCGNVLSLVGYTIVLFWFFKVRIHGEELLLVKFFGQDYIRYAQKTFVGIPGLD